tara:strand:+ start:51104 stop:52138 length:1035 start_codon:yes stop_codon:yes gene_type:complete
MNFSFLPIFLIFLSFFLSFLLIYPFKKIARKINLVSIPHEGGIRQDQVPISAGIIFGPLILVLTFIYYFFSGFQIDAFFIALSVGTLILLIINLIDDVSGLSDYLRLFFQFLFIFLLWIFFDIFNFIHHKNDLFFLVFISLGLIILINAFNFIDGADGLIASNSFLFSITLSIVFLLENQFSLAIIMLIFFGANLGFLFHNWSPAKIFMGDSGAIFHGSFFSVFIFHSIYFTDIPIFCLAILFSAFLVETIVVKSYILLKFNKVFNVSHKYHSYQQEIISTENHRRPAMISSMLNLFWTIPFTFLCYFEPQYGFLITILVCLPLIFISYYFGPARAKRMEKNGI